jgi:SAM-dependent methyltransferase
MLAQCRNDISDDDSLQELPRTHTASANRHSVACPVCQGACEDVQVHGLSWCYFCHHSFQTDLKVAVSYDATYAHQYDHRPVREMSDLRWDFIQSVLALPAASRILDVGYGNGAFLKRAKAADMAIFGVDLHTEDFGIPVVTFDTPQTYDLVCFFDSLEHFPDFAPILRLRTRNVIVSIPNTPDLLRTAPAKWRHFKPGEHLHYFSGSSLDTLMRNWGFPTRLAEGYPEDNLRGKLTIDGKAYDNIYTAIYTQA